jgi:hypothetical protein
MEGPDYLNVGGYLYYGAAARARVKAKQAADLAMENFDTQFEHAFQQFCAEGGLDRTTCRNEDLDRRYAAPVAERKKCIHGLTPLTCSACYLSGAGSSGPR